MSHGVDTVARGQYLVFTRPTVDLTPSEVYAVRDTFEAAAQAADRVFHDHPTFSAVYVVRVEYIRRRA